MSPALTSGAQLAYCSDVARRSRSRHKPSVDRKATVETREALIQAGLEEFGRQGLDTPSLDVICQRAGLTRGAFYVHFRDRDDFITAVMDRALRSFFDAVFSVGAEGDGLLQTVSRFQRALTDGGAALPFNAAVPLYRLVEACRRSALIRERFVWHLVDALTRLAAATRSGQRDATLRADVAPEPLALLLLSAALGQMVVAEAGFPLPPDDGGDIVAVLLRPTSGRKPPR